MSETIQQKILSLLTSSNGISLLEIQQKLNIKPQSIYYAISSLREKNNIISKNKKYYFFEKSTNLDKCENILCLHNVTNVNSTISKWNNTDCGIYEIDAYDEKENPTGFKIQDCPALLKYRKFGWM